jgi:hypothetical protein
MFTQTIVFVILSVMMATATYAASAPISKPTQDQLEPGESEKDSTHSL